MQHEQIWNMNRRYGVELVGRESRYDITYLAPLMDPAGTTFADTPDWHALGGHCTACERTGWLNRWEVAQGWGVRTFLGSLAGWLRK